MNLPSTTVQTDFASPLGRMILAAAEQRLVGVWFANQAHLPDLSIYPGDANNALLRQTTSQLSEYFAGRRQRFDLALDLSAGTLFQQAVWQTLLSIGYGQITTYTALALQVGKPGAVRAVAGALARNPISIVVPCHRVIAADTSLTGYAGGLPRKAALLQLEGAL